MSKAMALTPGFSPVMVNVECQNRFNGFFHIRKPLKRLNGSPTFTTRLKPGVNERGAGCHRRRGTSALPDLVVVGPRCCAVRNYRLIRCPIYK